MIFVIDIDETLADNTHRKHLPWEEFLSPENVVKDPAIKKGIDVVIKLLANEYHVVYFLTSRTHKLREATEQWLKQHIDPELLDRSVLLMREEQYEGMPGSVFKKQALDVIKSRRFPPFIVIDDDPHVLKMASEYGLALKAPGCWDIINPDNDLPPEDAWKK